MSKRTHPDDKFIANGRLASILIWVTRRRVPVFKRLYTAYLNCDIGGALPEDVFLPHPFGIVISSGTKIGKDVVIGHQVTLGNRNGEMAPPEIGDRVYIGAGAKILGSVKIGSKAIIGANAVITKNVPEGAKVVGANRLIS